MNKTLILKLSVLLTANLVFSQYSYANPQGAQVVHGQVEITAPSANVLNITNSPGAIINWQAFGINPNEITQFIQQGSHSAVLNRVIGQDPSQILGQLISNGKVLLVNPNGIVFGPNSIVDTAGLIASSLNITDQDFLNNNMQFDGSAESGVIQSQGYITAGTNGDIFLIAPNIENSGIIETDGGQIILAAGEKVTLASLDTENIVFEVQAATNEVTNLGTLITHGGAAEIFAGTITHSGSINADSLTVNDAGEIVLAALDNITVEADSLITANAKNGGDILVESVHGDTVIKGSIAANGTAGRGGSIHVLGQRVGLFENAKLDASGTQSGGEVLVGGDFQGKNIDIKNAIQTAVGTEAVIKANAIDEGDGGKVIVWADDFTDFHGAIEATGGENSGNGGFVEVSGKNSLNYHGEIDVTAAQGSSGSVLFDPKNLTVRIDMPPDNLSTHDEFAENSAVSADIDPSDIITLLDAGTTVTLQASNDLTINEDITSTGTGATLTLQAGRSVSIGADIDTNGGDFNATANSSLADGVVDGQRDTGAAEFRLSGGNTIDSSGGDITIVVSDGAGLTNSTAGNLVLEDATTVNSGGGTIQLTSKTGTIVLGSGSTGATVTSIAGTGGDIFIEADDLDIQVGSLITTPGTFSGNLTIKPFSTNRNISFGTGGGTFLEISAAELTRMTSIDTLTIGRSTDTGSLTVDTNLTSAGINASTLILQHQSIVTNNSIDLSGSAESLQLNAGAVIDINNAIDAGNVSIEAANATITPVTTVNIDSFTSNGTGVPTAVVFDGAGTTLFRSSTTLNTVGQSAGVIDTSAGQTVTINGIYTLSAGTIDGTVTANSTTTVGGAITINGVFNNNSSFLWANGNIGGTPGGGSGFNNNAGGSVTILGDGTFSQDFVNAGTVTKVTGTGTTSFDDFTNNATINANSGTIDFTGGNFATTGTLNINTGATVILDDYTQTSGLTKLNGGTLNDVGGATNINGGTLAGTGTITSSNVTISNGATLAPGTSPGTLNITGNLTLAPTSTTLIELGGTSQGSNYDFINVTGAVSLDGTLNVSTFGGFVGLTGNQFDIISSGSSNLTGSFASSIFPAGYSISSGIVGAGSLFRLGLLTVPNTSTLVGITPINEVLVLEENYDDLTLDDIVFPADETEEDYDDQVLICT